MNLAHISVIASDLDDTLLRKDGTISDATLALFARWEALGNRLIIATGRPTRSARATLAPILAHVPLICYNGAVAFENGDTIYEQYIPGPDVQTLVERLLARAPKARVGLEIDDQLFLNQEPPRSPLSGHTVVDLRTVSHRPAAKILLRHSQADLLGDALDDLPDSVQIMVSNRYDLIQIMPAGVDKAHALAVLVARWGLGLENVVAFGDDVNDVRMLKQCGLGVAVSNAVPEVLAAADHITGTPEEDGVGMVVEELLIENGNLRFEKF
ncbi:MAG: HAD family phosphatase [Caldilineaceae bacterium]|nr:HAD family phosphatase [Caldilineaceae bacterium]MBP8125025.1 HAD family phosphatase [Caldilineaceae bacterium]MBP9074774.1 HAD family phosphatase [Caldilineaceae bacterium]